MTTATAVEGFKLAVTFLTPQSAVPVICKVSATLVRVTTAAKPALALAVKSAIIPFTISVAVASASEVNVNSSKAKAPVLSSRV